MFMMIDLHDILLQTLAFYDVCGHAPTLPEWLTTVETNQELTPHERATAIQMLVSEGRVICRFGRYAFPDRSALIDEQRTNELWSARKRRIARHVTWWLQHLGGVRFVALCNSAALGHARDDSDLDFFIVVKAGALFQTRLLAALPFKLLGRRPHGEHERDAICLSYFVTDADLDLQSHMLSGDDPYFRYWFLALLPFYDDGVSADLWSANRTITQRHRLSSAWSVSPDLALPESWWCLPVGAWLERVSAFLQQRAFPTAIREMMNRDTRVLVSDRVLKFHVTDARGVYRERYEQNCAQRGIQL